MIMNKKLIITIVVMLILLVLIMLSICFLLNRKKDNNIKEEGNSVMREHVKKEIIINDFKENYGIFSSIANYAIRTEGELYVYYDNQKDQIIFYSGKENEEMDQAVVDDIIKLMNDLNFCSVYEFGTDEIYFVRETAYEQGICYLNKNFDPDYYNEIEKLKSQWYYFLKIRE